MYLWCPTAQYVRVWCSPGWERRMSDMWTSWQSLSWGMMKWRTWKFLQWINRGHPVAVVLSFSTLYTKLWSTWCDVYRAWTTLTNCFTFYLTLIVILFHPRMSPQNNLIRCPSISNGWQFRIRNLPMSLCGSRSRSPQRWCGLLSSTLCPKWLFGARFCQWVGHSQPMVQKGLERSACAQVQTI